MKLIGINVVYFFSQVILIFTPQLIVDSILENTPRALQGGWRFPGLSGV